MDDNVFLIAKGLDVMAPAYRNAMDVDDGGCAEFVTHIDGILSWLDRSGQMDRVRRIISSSSAVDLGL